MAAQFQKGNVTQPLVSGAEELQIRPPQAFVWSGLQFAEHESNADVLQNSFPPVANAAGARNPTSTATTNNETTNEARRIVYAGPPVPRAW